jgi:hypothetical protein
VVHPAVMVGAEVMFGSSQMSLSTLCFTSGITPNIMQSGDDTEKVLIVPGEKATT